MKFSEYQKKTRKHAVYPDKDNNFIFPVLGIAGETGEVAEKIKKVIRDKGGKINDETRAEIAKELGDVLWYIAQLATELNLNLDDVAEGNIKKTQSRLMRNKIHGDGDNR
ncbi:MAG: nucleoside triphosphate pyrophosphohydrolase family protein [Candidatus Moraniibacteriota bacterium]|jgi:NTP pyrophosphatase (non-canonical NTP hydrolase)